MTCDTISILGVKGGTTTVLGALVTAVNCNRIDQELKVQHISPELANQCKLVMVEGKWPLPTPAGGGEHTTMQRGNRQLKFTTISSPDFKLNRGEIWNLQGSALTVFTLDPTQDADVASRSVPARAYWMQHNLGLPAGEAIQESLSQHFGLTAGDLATRPKFLARVAKLNNPQVRWTHDASQDEFADRYPLEGINGRDVKQFWQELKDIILGECRKSAYELHLLGAVVAGADKLIVTFNRVEWLPTLPGVNFDYLGLAQKFVAPRPGVCYVAEKYVDYRLASDGESIEQLEGFCEAGPRLLWEGMRGLLDHPTASRATDERPRVRPATVTKAVAASTQSVPRPAAIAAAVALPLLFAVLVYFGGLMSLLIALGAIALLAGEIALLAAAMTPSGNANTACAAEQSQTASKAAPATQAAPQGASLANSSADVEIPPAIAERVKGQNGKLHHHA